MKTILLVPLIVSLCVARLPAGPSPFADGSWFKVGVTKSGVYRIDQSALVKIGLDPRIDPRKLSLYGTANGMLPQKNSESDGGTLIQIPIRVQGEADGIFHPQDYIMFYGVGPHAHHYDSQEDVFNYETNLYSDVQYYFLMAGEADGLRLQNLNSISGTYSEISEYEDWVYHETDRSNVLKSGRQWFGESFSSNNTLTLSFTASDIPSGSTVRIVSAVMAQTAEDAQFNLTLNGRTVGSQLVAAVPQTQYAIKGRVRQDTFRIVSEDLSMPGRSSHTFVYTFIKGASGFSTGYLDFLQVVITRSLSYQNGTLTFRSTKSLEQPISTFRIANAPATISLWDITDEYAPANQSFQAGGNQITFSASTDQLRTYAAFDAQSLPAPTSISSLANQDLAGLIPRTLLIITHPSLQSEAERLGTFREQQGTSALVVKTETIYNEYSGGRQDVTALRNFIRDLYNKYPTDGLKYVLLFGKATYDYKDHLGYHLNLVPTYESRNSLSPLETYSSDDYFAFLEPDEGEWTESPPENHTMDIGIGRIPARSLKEATQAVDKIVAYETEPGAYGRWRNEVAFVADDGDSNIHQSQANQLSEELEYDSLPLIPRKLYLDRYRQTTTTIGERSPDLRSEITRTAELGALVINFTGHGNEFQWMQERVLDDFEIQDWTNGPVYPFFVTATCEFGRQDDPAFQSSGEMLVLTKDAGAIGIVSTARPVSSATNFTLNKYFYDALSIREEGVHLPLGEVFRLTKNASSSGVSNRNFSLMGDPSLILAFARDSVALVSITSSEASDTLKAGATVAIAGQIMNASGTLASNFDGTVDVTVFEQQHQVTTRGNENSPFTFSEWDSPAFRGAATVTNGIFSVNFVVPRNINLTPGKGRINLYSVNDGLSADAAGDYRDIVLGNLATASSGDITGPVITLFLGDSTYLEGSPVTPDVDLVAYFSDASGISTAGHDPDYNLVGILDGQDTLVLSNYYESFVDDFTRGVVRYPLLNLTRGVHELVVKAYDTQNNPAMASLQFLVGEGALQVSAFGNYPNPMFDRATIYFTHNRPGEDLEADWELYGSTGSLIDKRSLSVANSGFRVDLFEWDGEASAGNKISPGLYVMRLTVRSLRDGTRAEGRSKLIVLK